MDYITDLVNNSVTSFIVNMANSFLKVGFELLTTFLINFSDVNKYIEIKDFLIYTQAIACALLSVTVAWNAFKTQSGGVFKGGNSLSVLAMKIVFSGASIYVLPYLVMQILVPINNIMIELINYIGKSYKITPENMFEVVKKVSGLDLTIGFGMLALSIALIVLSIMSVIRYFDLIICIIISPFVALSIVNDGEGLSTWARETFAIVFTQSIHILMLQLLMRILVKTEGIVMLIFAIGIVIVMIKGANILRTYTHKTGVGSGIVSMGSMAVMRSNISSLKSSMV
jgi:hypothetical protein